MTARYRGKDWDWTNGQDSQNISHYSADRETGVLKQAARTLQVGQASWRGQLGQDNGGRTVMAGEIQQNGKKDSTGQPRQDNPWQDSQETTARTGQGQLGQDDQHRTNTAGERKS